MKDENEDVIRNLKEANKCYLKQVNENEDLKHLLKVMQDEHKMMKKRFEDIEMKIQEKEEYK